MISQSDPFKHIPINPNLRKKPIKMYVPSVNIKKDRIRNIVNALSDGNIAKDRRGGDHVSVKSVNEKN